MKAVIYARYSSLNQNEQSIEGQIRECTAYALANNITIVDTYIDRAISGTTDHREEFQKMIKDSSNKLFDAIIVYKIDRFSRNRYDAAMYKSILKKNDVKLLYAKENIPDGPEGIILESLLEGMAEYYSAELSQKIKRGMRESALKCQCVGGKRVFGYKVNEEKKFEIDSSTAPYVKKIFTKYNNGEKIVDICDELNSLGIKTSSGTKFNKSSLWHMLRNEKYIGVYQMGDIRVEGGVPALVDKALFESVQKKLNQKFRTRAKVDYMLTTKLFCGKCKKMMIGESGTSKNGEKHNYYACSIKKKTKECDKKTVRKADIENLIVDVTTEYILQDDKIDLIASRCAEIMRNEASHDETLSLLTKQLADTRKSMQNIMNAIEQGIITKTTSERLKELEEIETRLEYEIEVRKLQKNVTLDEKSIKFMLEKYRNPEMDAEQYAKEIIDTFVHSVYLSDDRVIIFYNLANKEKTELENSVLDLLSECSEELLIGGGGEN